MKPIPRARPPRRHDLQMDAEAAFCRRAKPCQSPACIGCRFPELTWTVRYPLYRDAPRDASGYVQDGLA